MAEKTLEQIKAALDAMGYDYDARLGKENLLESLPGDVKAKLDAATAENAGVKMISCRVMRDYWPSENERVRKGTIVEVPLDEATLDAIESGAMERVKNG